MVALAACEYDIVYNIVNVFLRKTADDRGGSTGLLISDDLANSEATAAGGSEAVHISAAAEPILCRAASPRARRGA
jgi:hypothetical protein